MARHPVASPPRLFLPLNGVVATMGRTSPSIASLPSVLALTSDFLEFGSARGVNEAYAATRSLLIPRRVHERERLGPPMDPLCRNWVFKLCLNDAADRGDLATVQWLTTEYAPLALVLDAVELAAANGHLEVLKWLHDHCSDRTMFGMKEMWLASKGGYLDVLKWLHEHSTPYPALAIGSIESDSDSECVDPVFACRILTKKNLLTAAGSNGHLEAVQWIAECINVWMREKQSEGGVNGPGDGSSDEPRTIEASKCSGSCLRDVVGQQEPPTYVFVVDEAVANGHLEVLKWLQSANYAWIKLEMQGSCVGKAIWGGRLDVVKWVSQTFLLNDEPGAKLMDCAIRSGNMEILCWLKATGAFKWSLGAFVGAAHNGHMEMIRWLHDHFDECRSWEYDVPERMREVMDEAASEGHLGIVKFLHENRSEGYTRAAMNRAAANGHLDMVQWLHANRREGCSTGAMDWAAEKNYFAVVEWLAQHRHEGCSVEAISKAAWKGQLEMIKLLHEHGAKGRAHAMDLTARYGHLQVVKWLHENRTEGCTQSAMEGAAAAGHLEVVRFLHENRPEGCTSRAMDHAASNGHLDVVKWLHENRSEGCTDEAMDVAATNGHLNVVRWLQDNRTEGCRPEAMYRAAENGHFRVVVYLASHRSEGIRNFAEFYGAYRENHLEILQWLAAHFREEFEEGVRECLPTRRSRDDLQPYTEVWVRDRRL